MPNARRPILTTLATLCTAMGVLALASAPAQAASIRSVISSFGPGGPGSGVFSEVTGVAVEQSSHDVYVYDAGEGGRVYKFNAAGEPQKFSSLPANVIESVGGYGSGESEIAVSSSGATAGDIYVATFEAVKIYNSAGEELAPLTTTGLPSGVAVDPSGDVYVTFYEDKAIKKYTPTANPVTEADYTSSLSEVGEVSTIAVDSAGDVYDVVAYSDGPVTKYAASEFNTLGTPALFGTVIDPKGTTLAVDPSSGGDVYIDEGSDIAEYNPSGSRVESFGALSESYGVAESLESGDVYASAAKENGEVVIYGPLVVYPTVAVGSVSDLHGTSVTLNGTVNPEGTSVTACELEYGTTTRYGQSAPCVPAASPAKPLTGNSSIAVSAEVAGLQSGTKYYFRLAATNANGTEEAAETFETPGPRIDAESVAIVSSTSVELQAQIDPRGADTSYYFQYGTASCDATPSTCTDVPAPPGVEIGNGTTDQSVAQQAQGLAPGTYHYRMVAVQGSEAFPGLEHTFTTLPTAVAGLPDGRQWELVSPANKTGAEPEAITNEGGTIQASANGDAIAYVANGPFAAEKQPEGARNPEYTQILSTRGTKEWSSQGITTPTSTGSGIVLGISPEYQAFSTSLALALVQPFPETNKTKSGPFEHPPLSPPLSEAEAGHQEKTIYLRDDVPLAPEASEEESYEQARHDGELMEPENPGFLALVTEVNAPGGEPFGGAEGEDNEGLEFQGATPDLGHVVFYSRRAAPGLYEWGPGRVVQPVSVLPGQTSVAKESDLGGPAHFDARHAISDDGRLVFWTYETHLYVRDTVTKETLQLDTVKGGSGVGEKKPIFQTASANGSRVFFTDPQRLTAASKAAGEEEKPDLYVVELSDGTVAGGAPLTSTLTDLTPEGVNGESAAVVTYSKGKDGGGVLGASEDGSYVYFVAEGTLTPGVPATSGHCSEPVPAPGSTCDLYVRHYDDTGWAPTRFIATLSSEDAPDWNTRDLLDMTARVSPDGGYVAFMSDRSLTGYDNLDVNEATVGGEPGPHADEEVFLYDAGSEERLVCSSCDPSGARPAGVYDPKDGVPTGEGLGLLVDRPFTWGAAFEHKVVDHWLAGSVPGWTGMSIERAIHQPRYLSNSGRLFFNSPDRLVPAATSVKERVYEYEPDGVGGCESQAGCVGLISSASAEHESAFLDASENGNDVFFLTAEKLVLQDTDDFFDVYDAHVCEAASPCLSASTVGSSPPCEETPVLPCKGPGSFTPAFTAPASTSPSGSGNLPPPLSKPAVKSKAKPLTRAQQLTKALKQCGKLKLKHRRVACKKQARKRYGPKQKKAKKSSSGEGRRG